jgi:hypothetical protein
MIASQRVQRALGKRAEILPAPALGMSTSAPVFEPATGQRAPPTGTRDVRNVPARRRGQAFDPRRDELGAAAVLALQRTASNRAVVSLLSGRARTLQRFPVVGTNWDTSRSVDHDAIEDHIMGRNMSLAQLGNLVDGLASLLLRSEFEDKLLSFARYMRAGMRDINDVYGQASSTGGVWTKATVLVNGAEVLVTPPARAGGAQEHDASQSAERQASERDSEVATLASLGEYVGRANMGAWSNVNVIMSGSMAPCDGCKERLHESRSRSTRSPATCKRGSG